MFPPVFQTPAAALEAPRGPRASGRPQAHSLVLAAHPQPPVTGDTRGTAEGSCGRQGPRAAPGPLTRPGTGTCLSQSQEREECSPSAPREELKPPLCALAPAVRHPHTCHGKAPRCVHSGLHVQGQLRATHSVEQGKDLPSWRRRVSGDTGGRSHEKVRCSMSSSPGRPVCTPDPSGPPHPLLYPARLPEAWEALTGVGSCPDLIPGVNVRGS